MEKSNQLPKTEGCSAEGEPVDLWFYRDERPSRSVPTGKARAASGTRILLKQFSLESSRRKRGRCQLAGTQHGDAR